METVTLLGLLGICTIEDIREKQLHMIILSFFGIFGICIHMFRSHLSMAELLGGIAVGALLLVVSFLTGGRIGEGDGFLVMVTGIYLGFWQNLIVLWGAALLAGIFGIVFYLLVKRDRNMEIPFTPFYLLAYVITLLGQHCL